MLELFGYIPHPDRPGWVIRQPMDGNRFLDIYGVMEARIDADGRPRLSLMPADIHRNMLDKIHGGFLMAVIDHALFVGPGLLGIERAVGGITIDVSIQFLAPVNQRKPIDAVIEVLRDTYRMVFMRGTIEQDGTAAVAFSGTIKKASANS